MRVVFYLRFLTLTQTPWPRETVKDIPKVGVLSRERRAAFEASQGGNGCGRSSESLVLHPDHAFALMRS